MKLKDLASEYNRHINQGVHGGFPDWVTFYETWIKSNLNSLDTVFRWGIHKAYPSGYKMRLSIMTYNNVTFNIEISTVREKDVPQILEYLQGHFIKLMEGWRPITDRLTK